MKTVLAIVLLTFAGVAHAQVPSSGQMLNWVIQARIQQKAADAQAAQDAAAAQPAPSAQPEALPPQPRAVPYSPTRYSKVGATQEQFMSDRYACVKEAMPSRSVFIACMGARGYDVNPTGDLAAPPGMTIFFTQP